MEKYGNISVSAIQTLTICVRLCQRKQGSDDPDSQYQRGTENLCVYGTKMGKKVKTDSEEICEQPVVGYIGH